VVLSHGTGVRFPVPVPSFAKRSLRSRLRMASHASACEGWSTVARSASVPRAKVDDGQLPSPSDDGVVNGSCLSTLSCHVTEVFRRVISGGEIAQPIGMSKRYAYVLKNEESPPSYYTGLTSHLARRLAEHSADGPHRTCRYRPWSVDVLIEFADERRAAAFERYLKSGQVLPSHTGICDNLPRASLRLQCDERTRRRGAPRRAVGCRKRRAQKDERNDRVRGEIC
jgi:putative endonuclease